CLLRFQGPRCFPLSVSRGVLPPRRAKGSFPASFSPPPPPSLLAPPPPPGPARYPRGDRNRKAREVTVMACQRAAAAAGPATPATYPTMHSTVIGLTTKI